MLVVAAINFHLLRMQTRQNVVDVSHHVTQYLHIIDALQCRVSRLRNELDKATTTDPTAAAVGSSEARQLCESLRQLTLEQRDIR